MRNKIISRLLLKARTIFWIILACFFVLSFISKNLPAQNLGSINGTVTDPSGAVIPGVKIIVINQETGLTIRTTVTNANGNYSVPDLPNSTYTVRAEKQGFTTSVHRNVIMHVGSVIRVDLKLAVGAVTQEVTVVAPAVHLQTQTGSQSQTISGTQVALIDINARNFVQLATLVPGAAAPGLVGTLNPPVGSLANFGIYFNGEEADHNVWMIDGLENYDRGGGGGAVMVPDQDAIQEFKVQDSNNNPEVGFGSGAHIQVALKNGTDQFHGEAFEFNRNTALDASTFFANASNTPKPILNFNDYGFDLGGPIFLPGHKKKLFFFFDADWRSLDQGTTIDVPGVPLGWSTGDFSSSKQVILNHNSASPCPGQPSLTCYQPFAGNLIPSSMLNPNAEILGKPNLLFPTPNSGQFFVSSPTVPTTVDEQILRMDYNVSDKTSIMFHFLRNGNNQTQATTLWSSDSYPTLRSEFLNNPQQYEMQVTRSISPTLLNEFMVGFQRQPITVLPEGNFAEPPGLTIQPLYPGTNTDNRVPTLQMYGPALGTAVDASSWPWTNVLNTWTLFDSLSKIVGNHSLNFGFVWEHYLKQQELFGTTQGTYTFNGSATGGNYVGPNGQILSTPGNEFADFMLGDVFQYSELQQQTMPAYINNLYAPWFGDTWKVRNDLTLNLGLRWEGMPHAYEQYNQISVFRTSLYNPADAPKFNPNGSLIPGSGNFLDGIGIAGQDGVPPGLVDNHWTNFEPRLGFAWSPHGSQKTVVRGGYGIFYENIQGNDIYNVAPNPPFSHTPLIFNTNLTNPGIVPGTIFPGNVQAYQPIYQQPYSQQWSFGVEHQFTPLVMLSTTYVGSKGTDEQINYNLNQPLAPVVGEPINLGRPYLGWGNIGWYSNSTSSNYESLQANLRFTNWHGLTSGVSYTWSHCLDYSDGDVGGFIQNAYNIPSEYGNCGFNIPNMLQINYVYNLPIFTHTTGLARTMLGGWQVSGISTFYSGSPYTVGFPGDPAECGCSAYRADLIGNPNVGTGIHTASDWFNTAAFAAVPLGQFGNSARNLVYGDGIDNWDLSIFKNFTGIPFPGSREGATMQLRFEFYNLFNTAQFNSFFTTFGTPGFGAPNGTLDPREIQIGAKFSF
jgi:hypothetical protein